MKIVDSTTINLPKNLVQYLIGFAFYILTFGSFDLMKLIFGALGFLISYSSVYIFNDLTDYKEDIKDEFKKQYKAIARGSFKIDYAVSLLFILSPIGLFFASLVSQAYLTAIVILLVLNYIYTAKPFRLKKKLKYAVILMFLMQIIKGYLGWITFTNDLTKFPYWVNMTFALSYIFGYVLYKKDVSDMKKTILKYKKYMLSLAGAIIASFFISLIIYPYKLPLLILIPCTFFVLTAKDTKNKVLKNFKLAGISITLMYILLLGLFLLNVEPIKKLNENTTQMIDKINNLLLNKVDNNTYGLILIINQTIYSKPIYQIEDVSKYIKEINVSIKK